MFELAENLLRGQHVLPDPLRAVQFLEQASSLGHVVATWTLGQLLISGCDGVQRDAKRGIAMITVALKADPSITKKVFVPYTNSAPEAATPAAIQPASSALPAAKAVVKADKSPSLLLGRLPLYGAAIAGFVCVMSIFISRMRKK
jgi:hypothetical protein